MVKVVNLECEKQLYEHDFSRNFINRHNIRP